MRKALFTQFFLAASLLMLAACDHKELCFDLESHSSDSGVNIVAQYEQEWQYDYEDYTDWASSWPESFAMDYDDLRPGLPEGLRMQVYNEDGGYSTMNLDPEGETVKMQAGEHSLLFYNNDTEYIVFDEMQSFASAKATTRTRTRSSYLGNIYKTSTDGSAEKTVNPPDMLYGSYKESYVCMSSVYDELPVDMHPLVFSYLIRYEFSYGLEYVAIARGALAGMAEAVWLNSGRTSDEEATLLFDCTVEEFGAQATVHSFGIPDFPNEHYATRAARSYALNLEVRLTNGKYLSFDFDVTSQVEAQPQGGVIVVDGIGISDEEGANSGSGFSVSVDDWGEFEDIDLNF